MPLCATRCRKDLLYFFWWNDLDSTWNQHDYNTWLRESISTKELAELIYFLILSSPLSLFGRFEQFNVLIFLGNLREVWGIRELSQEKKHTAWGVTVLCNWTRRISGMNAARRQNADWHAEEEKGGRGGVKSHGTNDTVWLTLPSSDGYCSTSSHRLDDLAGLHLISDWERNGGEAKEKAMEHDGRKTHGKTKINIRRERKIIFLWTARQDTSTKSDQRKPVVCEATTMGGSNGWKESHQTGKKPSRIRAAAPRMIHYWIHKLRLAHD